MTAGNQRAGFALLAALLALVVALALMGAGSWFALSETRLLENEGHEAQAAGAAEYGAAETLAGWSEAWDTVEVVAIPERPTAGNTGRYWGFVRRLGRDISLIDVIGVAGESRARVGLMIERVRPTFPEAALVSGGDVGDLDLGRVARGAQLTLPAGRYQIHPTDGPVIHILGDAEVTDGSGSGVLLVDGDLRIEGPLTFRGVVITRGVLVVSGSGPAMIHLIGSVVTFVGVSGDSSMSVTYDKAIIDSVLQPFGRLSKLDSRSWIRLF